MSQPPSYGVTAFRLRNLDPLRRALSLRPYFREPPEVAAERARDPGSGPASALAYASLQRSAFNVCLSDNLTFDAGFGVETVFTVLRGPSGAELPHGHPAAAGAARGVVAPWQLLNHMPNSSALINKAGLIRSLHRFYTSAEGGGGGGGGGAAASAAAQQHVFECVLPA